MMAMPFTLSRVGYQFQPMCRGGNFKFSDIVTSKIIFFNSTNLSQIFEYKLILKYIKIFISKIIILNN